MLLDDVKNSTLAILQRQLNVHVRDVQEVQIHSTIPQKKPPKSIKEMIMHTFGVCGSPWNARDFISSEMLREEPKEGI